RIRANPEDQLKRPVCELLEKFYAKGVRTRTEAQVEGLGARPDIGVELDKLLCGHVELKAPGKGAAPSRFSGPDKQQWKKFKALPNLIYTDGFEWGLYRTGDRIDKLVTLPETLLKDGAKAVTEDIAHPLHRLLTD